jgi:hypothetical protein
MSAPSVQLNEPVLRIIAFLVAALAITFAFTELLVIPLFLLFDFYLRGWEMQRFSILRWVAVNINHYFLGNRQKPVFAAPKLFAAKIGALLSFGIILAYVTGYSALSVALAGMMTGSALLESGGGFSVGCYLYTYFERLRQHLHF